MRTIRYRLGAALLRPWLEAEHRYWTRQAELTPPGEKQRLFTANMCRTTLSHFTGGTALLIHGRNPSDQG